MSNSESTPTSSLDLHEDVIDGVMVLTVGGEIDVVTAPAFEAKLTELAKTHEGATLLANLLSVTFLSSAGLSALMRFADTLPEGCRFLVAAEGPTVLRPMQLTGVVDALEVFPSVDDALATI